MGAASQGGLLVSIEVGKNQGVAFERNTLRFAACFVLTLALAGIAYGLHVRNLAIVLGCYAIVIAEAIVASRWPGQDPLTFAGRSNVEHLARAHEWAQEDRRHGEAITQTRLNNFLFSSSILVVAWATVYASEGGVAKYTFVLQILSAANFFLSLAYGFFGIRNKRTLGRHRSIVIQIEKALPKELQTTHALERGTPAEGTGAGEQYLGVSTHDMLWGVPAALLLISVLLFDVSLR